MRYLIIFFVLSLASCNHRISTNLSRYNEYAEINPEEAAESILWLEDNFLTVVIPTDYRKKQILLESGNTAEAAEIDRFNDRYLELELAAFSEYYNFSKVYYILSEDWKKFLKGEAPLRSLDGEEVNIIFAPEQIQLHYNRTDYEFNIRKNGKPVPKYFPSRNGSASEVKRAHLFDSVIEDEKINADLKIAIGRWQKGLKNFRDEVNAGKE